MQDHTMVHDLGFLGAEGVHRRATVEKVDNGFIVKARVPITRKVPDVVKEYGPPTTRDVEDVTDRTYVFYTTEEVVKFMQGYLDSKDLGDEKPSG